MWIFILKYLKPLSEVTITIEVGLSDIRGERPWPKCNGTGALYLYLFHTSL